MSEEARPARVACTSCDERVGLVDGAIEPHGCPLPAGHPELELTEQDEEALADLALHRWISGARFERLTSIGYARPGRHGRRPSLTSQGEDRLRQLEAERSADDPRPRVVWWRR